MLFYVLWGRDTGLPGARAWGSLVYLGLVGTLFCFVVVWAQKVVIALQVMIIFALEPIFSLLVLH